MPAGLRESDHRIIRRIQEDNVVAAQHLVNEMFERDQKRKKNASMVVPYTPQDTHTPEANRHRRTQHLMEHDCFGQVCRCKALILQHQ